MNRGLYGFHSISSAIPYKIYVALLTQTSTNAPIAKVLENTIGDLIWTYVASGEYLGTIVGGFPVDKYFSPLPFGGYDTEVNQGSGGNAYSWYRLNNNSIKVVTTENGILNNSPIEFRVYK